MSSFDEAEPTQPLRTILSEDQISFLREKVDEYDLNEILDQSPRDLMRSDEEPSPTDLLASMASEADRNETSNDLPVFKNQNH